MTWMLTATGAAFDLRFIEPATISLLDIAHHLAQINRFTGACKRPYSVAEHSLLVCDLLEQFGITDPAVRLAGLMHDAHEAYTTDLSSPMKQLIGKPWQIEEKRIQYAVLKRFRLLTAFTSGRLEIDRADLVALCTERRYLLPPTKPGDLFQIDHTRSITWDFESRAAMTWLDWRQAFIDKFDELQFARAERATEQAGDPASSTND
jgi:hypothetical protein